MDLTNVIMCSKDDLIFKFGAAAVTYNGMIHILQPYWNKISEIEREALLVRERVHLKQQKDNTCWYIHYLTFQQIKGNRFFYSVKI